LPFFSSSLGILFILSVFGAFYFMRRMGGRADLDGVWWHVYQQQQQTALCLIIHSYPAMFLAFCPWKGGTKREARAGSQLYGAGCLSKIIVRPSFLSTVSFIHILHISFHA
jgi:hypothetical protein